MECVIYQIKFPMTYLYVLWDGQRFIYGNCVFGVKIILTNKILLPIFRCAQSVALLVSTPKNKKKKSTDENEISVFVVELLLVTNVTLLLIDQIHFQYNGFLFGILLVSISHMLKVKMLNLSFYF